MSKSRYTKLALACCPLFLISWNTAAQEEEKLLEEVVVTASSIRDSLQSALDQKRDAASLVEVIKAEDIGKLPDQNLAEVLENVTGIQITRTAGVGTGVQIRGTSSNRTEINGVSTVGSGTGRSGISFEDVSAAIIASVEVVKSPEAKTIEGSVGGTINLKTIRPLDLDEPLVAARVQGEQSSLSEDGGTSPRYSGTFGNVWETEYGDFGAVISASYSEQDANAFRPRADRDNFVAAGESASADFDFLPAQFFVQDYDDFEFETTNFAGAFEWQANDNLKLYFDAVLNDQERNEESSRVQTSGISTQRFAANITEFETVDFGSLQGINGSQDLGSIAAAVRGIIPAQVDDRFDPNLRLSGDTNSRNTESEIFRFGGEWENETLKLRVEASTSTSDTRTPSINTTLNFINPNTPIGDDNENATPIEFDLTGGSLTFGIAESEANAPTTAQLLDPANYRLRDVNVRRDIAENTEDAFRIDLSYYLDWKGIRSIDVGYRYNETTSLQDQVRSNLGLRSLDDSPSGDTFASLLTAGPDNFDEADGRDLFFPDFLTIDPSQVISNQEAVLETLNAAILAHQATTGSTRGGIDSPSSSTGAFFDVTEETDAFYAQANFDYDIVRGNFGLRYVDTEINSRGNAVLDGVATPTSSSADYDFLLPRLNLLVDVTENVLVRAGWGEDIRRPDFNDLSTAFSFSTSPNPAVSLGNPGLVPEEVESFDISADWYFAPASVISIGYFHKEREGVFTVQDSDPVEDANGFRDTTDPCEDGGIFNPIADPNVFAPPGTPPGVCVPTSQVVNGSAETTQKGYEITFQYDLGQFEEQLGWASGFGFIANLTEQEFSRSGGDEFFQATSRAQTIFNSLGATDTVTFEAPLVDLSETAYNLTVYYEKYGLSARLRYTWRDEHRSNDFGSTQSRPFGFPVVQEERGQLNASISYDINEKFNIGLEAVNITEEETEQNCVNSGSLLCFQGLTDRRITFGVSYRM